MFEIDDDGKLELAVVVPLFGEDDDELLLVLLMIFERMVAIDQSLLSVRIGKYAAVFETVWKFCVLITYKK